MERVVFRPEYIDQINVRFTFEGLKRRIIRGDNVSVFHSHAYQALFGGKVSKPHKGDIEKIMEGISRNFQPDIIKILNGNKFFTEVKTMTNRDQRPQCGFNQFENYCYNSLKDERVRKLTTFNYAFFRYRTSVKSLDPLTNPELEKYLAKNTMDLVILPPNMLFALFARSERKARNQQTNKGPDIAWYFRPRISDINALLRDGGAEQKLHEDYRVEDFAKYLVLDNIVCETYQSPPLSAHRTHVTPFRVVHYFNRNEKAWRDSFRKHHEVLLREMLHLKDIYADIQEVPFN